MNIFKKSLKKSCFAVIYKKSSVGNFAKYHYFQDTYVNFCHSVSLVCHETNPVLLYAGLLITLPVRKTVYNNNKIFFKNESKL